MWLCVCLCYDDTSIICMHDICIHKYIYIKHASIYAYVTNCK